MQEQSTVEYRDIPGYPAYRVGSDGSVWSMRRVGRRFKRDRMSPLTSGVWRQLRPRKYGAGYLYINLRKNGRIKIFALHRLVLECFVGPQPPGMVACHFPDPCKTNCCIGNLRWDTQAANVGDAIKHGVIRKGSQSWNAKLTVDAVRESRSRYASGGVTVAELAAEYGVSRLTMGDAIRRVTWGHVV